MTEDEAKSMRCCGPSSCGVKVELADEVDFVRLCIGAKCMAWRWLAQTDRQRDRDGFCGIAGVAGVP